MVTHFVGVFHGHMLLLWFHNYIIASKLSMGGKMLDFSDLQTKMGMSIVVHPINYKNGMDN